MAQILHQFTEIFVKSELSRTHEVFFQTMFWSSATKIRNQLRAKVAWPVIDTWCPKNQVLGEPDENGVQLDQRNHTIFLDTGGKGSIEDQFKKSGYLLDLAKHYGVCSKIFLLFNKH